MTKTVLFANILDGSVMETPQQQGDEDDHGFMCCGTARNDIPRFVVCSASMPVWALSELGWGELGEIKDRR